VQFVEGGCDIPTKLTTADCSANQPFDS